MKKEPFDFDEPSLNEALQKIAKSLNLTDLTISRYDGRKVIGVLPDGRSVSLHWEPVPARNAKKYRGWFAAGKDTWEKRILIPVRPDSVVSMTVLIARADDERWWWTQAFYDDKIRGLADHIHRITKGFWRLPPSVLGDAAATPLIDLLQTTLFDDAQPPACDHENLQAMILMDGSPGHECVVCREAFKTEPAYA